MAYVMKYLYTTC